MPNLLCTVKLFLLQEETLSEVQRIEGEAATFLDQISRYLLTQLFNESIN